VLTREWAINTIVIAVLSSLVNRGLIRLIGCCAVRGNRVLRPRALLFADLFLSVTLGAVAGLTAGFTRFLMGVVWLVFRMTLLARPVLPRPLAGYDAGFAAYGGMLKCAWAWRLHPQSAPIEPAA
jgi:hypothetical protein